MFFQVPGIHAFDVVKKKKNRCSGNTVGDRLQMIEEPRVETDVLIVDF